MRNSSPHSPACLPDILALTFWWFPGWDMSKKSEFSRAGVAEKKSRETWSCSFLHQVIWLEWLHGLKSHQLSYIGFSTTDPFPREAVSGSQAILRNHLVVYPPNPMPNAECQAEALGTIFSVFGMTLPWFEPTTPPVLGCKLYQKPSSGRLFDSSSPEDIQEGCQGKIWKAGGRCLGKRGVGLFGHMEKNDFRVHILSIAFKVWWLFFFF